MTIEIGQYKFWMNGFLNQNLDIILKKAIPHKWDALFVLFGREGSGKSTLATQMAIYLDNSFNLDKCVFTPAQFTKAIETAKYESSIVWDEAITGANVALHASEISTTIISKLTQIRKKKLKIILCFPYLYMLNRYFISRCIMGIYIYAKDFDDRGYGILFDSMSMGNLYGLMKEKYRYDYYKALKEVDGIPVNFSPKFCLPEKEYDKKKDLAVSTTSENPNELRWKKRCYLMFKAYPKVIKAKDMAKLWGITTVSIYTEFKAIEKTLIDRGVSSSNSNNNSDNNIDTIENIDSNSHIKKNIMDSLYDKQETITDN